MVLSDNFMNMILEKKYKKMYKISLIIISILIFGKINSQELKHHSAHKSQKEYFDFLKKNHPKQYLNFWKAKKMASIKKTKDCNLEKIVFGWHPYWAGDAYQNYRWDMLSDLSFFSYEVDYLTGNAITTHDFETANVIDEALANNVRVNLCVTMFDDFSAFFGNATAQQTLIDNLLTLVENRNINGVNIDFEGVPSSQKSELTAFITSLANQFHGNIVNSQVSIALPAVDWADVFDINALKDKIDLFLIMGYDYYWTSGGVGNIAGPTGQLYTMYNFDRNQSRSVIYYLNEGVAHEKLCLGMPYYGFDWMTNNANVPTEAIADGQAIFIKTVKQNSNGYYSNKHFEDSSLCAYYNYNDGNYHQAWIDDEETMKYKYDIVLRQGIAGIGIWALGYDDGYTEMWDLIENKFSTCAEVPTSYDFFDMGGPLRNHYDREDYTYTIAPTNYNSNLTLSFTSFELEAGYDSLWIYDGVDINAPLIGGYSGTTSPGTIEASGGALTVRFHSDGATVKQGWNAHWTCNSANIENSNNEEFEIYPNPANDIMKIKSVLPPTSLKLFSLQGKLFKKVRNSNYINTSNLKNGFYLLEVNFSNSVSTKKIIIQH